MLDFFVVQTDWIRLLACVPIVIVTGYIAMWLVGKLDPPAGVGVIYLINIVLSLLLTLWLATTVENMLVLTVFSFLWSLLAPAFLIFLALMSEWISESRSRRKYKKRKREQQNQQ